MTLDNIKNVLRKFRENNERQSRAVIEMWTDCIKWNLDKLGKEKHLILEQVCVAALDLYELDIADLCINCLYQDFPNSLRVKKYEAMRFETSEHYDKALKILDNIIMVDETNSSARKRKVAILKAQGKNADAIKELSDYLKIFMADTEAWQELSELYITEQDYNKAAFCVEELILHCPHNHLLHLRYADIRYTQGGVENLELAKAYYTQALQLNDRSVRSMYGLYMTTSNLAVCQKYTPQKKKEALKTSESIMEMLKKHYDFEAYSSSLNVNEDLNTYLSALSLS